MVWIAMALCGAAAGQVGDLVARDVEGHLEPGEPIVREDFERYEPADAVLLDERQDGTWVLRTKDWKSPLLNSTGDPPDLTYDPELTGLYDIYLGTRATDFPVVVGIGLESDEELSVITCPRATKQVHHDWEICVRRAAVMDGERIVIRAMGAQVYVDYLKFVPLTTRTKRARVATDHVVIGKEAGRHFAFPGVARLEDGSLTAVAREGTAHVDPSGSIALWRSTDGGRTWGDRKTIRDDPDIDERDPGICQHSDGALVVSMATDGPKVMRSEDGGETWDEPTPAPVFSPHGPREMADGKLYWCGIVTRMGISHVRIATSGDLGRTWEIDATVAMSLPYHQPWVRNFWDEPWALPLGAGRWLALHRVDWDGYLYQNESPDDGKTVTDPKRTGMWGCPPFVMKLWDGRLLALYGYRREPFGIRGCISRDEGATWDVDEEIIIRDDGGHGDLGYPTGIEIEPGLVLVVYYHNDGGAECSIEGTFLSL